jgi:CubicO group peptidase (beta-lactamase class C family)
MKSHSRKQLTPVTGAGQPARVVFALGVAALSLMLYSFSTGQPAKPRASLTTTPAEAKNNSGAGATHEMTAADVEAFLDGLMPLALERDDIAGAVVAVVKDDKVLFAKGYGYADLAKKKPVSPDSTLFRPGSISKLFTWTSVMQLVEQGKLDLDRDVNDYLDFKIPATYPQPITLRQIMTHTAGFGETGKDLFIKDTKDLQPLRTYLVSHMPNRIFQPGTVPAYSNYATTLAGYIVERVSGEPFNDYVKDNIFTPLGMTRTTFVQPLPEDLKPLMSEGYRTASGGAKSFEVVQAWPAGSVSTAAIDMTHFMIAHLQNGEFNGNRILRPETAQMMHSRQFAPHPAMNGMALGFYEETRNGHRIIGHGGDTVYFHSDLHLMPNDGVGFFVSYNSFGKGEISNRTALWEKFLDRYFPYEIPVPQAVATAAADAREVAGHYVSSRRFQGNFLQALNAIGQAKVYGNSDGTISVDALKDFNGKPKKFREIAPLVFRDVNGQDRIAFQRDAGGKLYFAIDYPFFIFQRVGLMSLGPLNVFVFCASAAIMLLALLFWPIAALVRRHFGRRLELSQGERPLRFLTRLVCALNLVFLLSLAGLASTLEEPGAVNSHLDLRLHILQAIGVLGAVGTLVAIFNALRVWRSTTAPAAASAARAGATGTTGSSVSVAVLPAPRWWWSKVFETLIALACLGFAWFAVYWNLLNFSSKY